MFNLSSDGPKLLPVWFFLGGVATVAGLIGLSAYPVQLVVVLLPLALAVLAIVLGMRTSPSPQGKVSRSVSVILLFVFWTGMGALFVPMMMYGLAFAVYFGWLVYPTALLVIAATWAAGRRMGPPWVLWSAAAGFFCGMAALLALMAPACGFPAAMN